MKAKPFGVLTKDAVEVSESKTSFRMKITANEESGINWVLILMTKIRVYS